MKARFPILLFLLFTLSFGLVACDKPEEKRTKYIERGNVLFEKKDYARARIEYKNAARIDPADADVRYRMALVDEAQGNIGGAIKGFMAAEQQNPHHGAALAKLAHYLMTANELVESRKRVDVLLVDTPDNPQAHALLSAILLREGKLDEAEKEARFALEKTKGHVLATSVMAGIFSARGQTEQAFSIIEDGLSVFPKDLSLLLLKVMLYAKNKDMPQMAAAYEPIFAAFPDDLNFRFDLAESWIKAGDLGKAEETLRSALAAKPDNRDVRHRLFQFLSTHRGFDVAEKEISGFIANSPDEDELPFWLAELYMKHNVAEKAVVLLESLAHKTAEETAGLNARTTLARIHLLQGHRETAEKLVAFVLANNPSNTDALFVRARLAYDDGNYEKAVGDLRTVAQNRQAAPRALLLMAETLLKQGRLDLATDSLAQLLSIDPTDQKARVRLAQFFGQQGDKQRALATIKLVSKMDPTYAIGWESAARLAIDAKDWPMAHDAVAKLDTLEGQKLTALFLRAEIWARTGQNAEAAKAFQHVIRTAPAAPIAEHALRALAGLEATPDHMKNVAAFAAPFAFENATLATLYGQILATSGDLENAAEAFDKAITMAPQTQDAFVERAKLYIASSEMDKAIHILQTAMQNVVSDMRAPFLLADIMTAQNKPDEAIQLYEALLERNPALDLAANNLAQLMADTHANDPTTMNKARALAERFISSNNPYFLDTLGWVYLQSGDLAQATPVIERAMALANVIPQQMHYHYGMLLLRLGRSEQAKESLSKATQGNGTYAGRPEAEKWLATLPK